MYCGIVLPADNQIEANESLVFDNFGDAILALKKYPGARMKKFPSKQEAISFSTNTEIDQNISNVTASDFSPSLEKKRFPSPTPSDLSALRKYIQSNNVAETKQAIWNNPRLLVSINDNAVILMHGPKFNACHIAAKNKPEPLKLILETITDEEFIQKLYPDDPIERVQETIIRLLDSYLNTPDPRRGFSPLHYACLDKCSATVKILLNYRSTDKTLRDINKKTARDLVKDDPEIDKLFDDIFYIPIYRDEEGLIKFPRPTNFMMPDEVDLNTSIISDLDTSCDVSFQYEYSESYQLISIVGPTNFEDANCLYKIMRKARKQVKHEILTSTPTRKSNKETTDVDELTKYLDESLNLERKLSHVEQVAKAYCKDKSIQLTIYKSNEKLNPKRMYKYVI